MALVRKTGLPGRTAVCLGGFFLALSSLPVFLAGGGRLPRRESRQAFIASR